MRKIKKIGTKKRIYLLLFIVWMVVVFTFSMQGGDSSSETSTVFTEKVLDVLRITKGLDSKQIVELVELVNPIMRKLAHYTLYVIGGFLAVNFINIYNFSRKKVIAYSWGIGTIYAITDEIHQYFVPGRGSMFTDVLIDSLGVLTGVVLFFILIKVVFLLKLRFDLLGVE